MAKCIVLNIDHVKNRYEQSLFVLNLGQNLFGNFETFISFAKKKADFWTLLEKRKDILTLSSLHMNNCCRTKPVESFQSAPHIFSFFCEQQKAEKKAKSTIPTR